MGKASEGQFRDLISKFLIKVDEKKIDDQKIQKAIDSLNSSNSIVAGNFVDWINNDCVLQVSDLFTVTGPLSIHIPALPRPTLEGLQKNFSWIKSIERDTSPTEAVTLNLATVLRKSESQISGTEYERRIAPKLSIILGYQQAVWLVEHQDEFPEFMNLIGEIYIDFSGLFVVHGGGYRLIPYLYQFGGRWGLYWDWLSSAFDRVGRIAFSGK